MPATPPARLPLPVSPRHDDHRAAPARSGRAAAWRYAALALLIASLLAAVAWSQWRARAIVLEQAADQGRNLAQTLSAQIARTFDAVSLTLEVAGDDLDGFERPVQSSPARAQRLSSRAAGRPELSSIRVYDQDAWLVLDSQSWPAPAERAPDPQLLEALRRAEPGQTLLAAPVVTATLPRPFVPVARRVEAPEGGLAGMIVGAVPVASLERLLGVVRLPPGAAVSLLTDSGTAIARIPAVEGLAGRALANSPLFRRALALQAEGVTVHRSSIDGVTRLHAYTRVGGYPLVLVVAFSRAEVLADWRDNALRTGLLAAAVLVAAALAGVALLREIGRREASERELAAAKEAAEAANAAKSRFLAVMSHEIRTPLTGVIGLADLMLAREDDPRRLGDLRLLRRSAGSLKTLLSDLLDFAKIEAGKLTLESMEFSPAAVVREAVELFSAQADERGDTIRVELRDLPAVVRGDPTRLRQVLLNLVGNAVKFTQDGQIDVIAFAVDPAGTRLGFEVRDTGPGLSEQARHALYGAFNQGDSSITRRYGGTGLGLAICRALVEAMGGRIDASNRPVAGAEFRFDIVVAPVEGGTEGVAAGTTTAPPDPADSAEPLAVIADGACGGRLLLAEDNPINRRLVAAMLEAAGHVVDVAENGEQALRALDEVAYDTVLMDAHMPVLDGIAATRRLRARPDARSRTPVVLLSADVALFSDPVIAGLFDAHVAKPVDWPALNAALEALVPLGAALDAGDDGPGDAWTDAWNDLRNESQDEPQDELRDDLRNEPRDDPPAKLLPQASGTGPTTPPAPLAAHGRVLATGQDALDRMAVLDRGRLEADLASLGAQLQPIAMQLPRHIEQSVRRAIDAWRAGDRAGTHAAAHALAGAVSNFGCDRLARAAQAVCQAPSDEALERMIDVAADTLLELGAWMREQSRTQHA